MSDFGLLSERDFSVKDFIVNEIEEGYVLYCIIVLYMGRVWRGICGWNGERWLFNNIASTNYDWEGDCQCMKSKDEIRPSVSDGPLIVLCPKLW